MPFFLAPAVLFAPQDSHSRPGQQSSAAHTWIKTLRDRSALKVWLCTNLLLSIIYLSRFAPHETIRRV